jgi:hypothetical protein
VAGRIAGHRAQEVEQPLVEQPLVEHRARRLAGRRVSLAAQTGWQVPRLAGRQTAGAADIQAGQTLVAVQMRPGLRTVAAAGWRRPLQAHQ